MQHLASVEFANKIKDLIDGLKAIALSLRIWQAGYNVLNKW